MGSPEISGGPCWPHSHAHARSHAHAHTLPLLPRRACVGADGTGCAWSSDGSSLWVFTEKCLGIKLTTTACPAVARKTELPAWASVDPETLDPLPTTVPWHRVYSQSNRKGLPFVTATAEPRWDGQLGVLLRPNVAGTHTAGPGDRPKGSKATPLPGPVLLVVQLPSGRRAVLPFTVSLKAHLPKFSGEASWSPHPPLPPPPTSPAHAGPASEAMLAAFTVGTKRGRDAMDPADAAAAPGGAGMSLLEMPSTSSGDSLADDDRSTDSGSSAPGGKRPRSGSSVDSTANVSGPSFYNMRDMVSPSPDLLGLVAPSAPSADSRSASTVASHYPDFSDAPRSPSSAGW
jgi:hypothetical protein